MRNSSRMSELIAALGDEDTGLAELAEAELRDYGHKIVEPLLEAMPGFGNFGIVSAVELLEEFGDERAGPILISLLESDERVVREWVADALGTLGIRGAIDPLKLTYERAKARGTPLHWTEPTALRRALTKLGAREEVIPPSVERLRRIDSTTGRYWEWEHADEVVDALADADQAIVLVQIWEGPGGMRVRAHGGEPDWSLPWRALVQQTRRAAKSVLSGSDAPPDAVVTLEWMKENDM
jgi:HEAT repeat protein